MKTPKVLKVFNFFLPPLIALLGFAVSLPVPGQAQNSNTLTTAATSAVCVWPQAELRESPGQVAGFIENLTFGSRVQVLGEMRYVPDEDRVYMKVTSPAGRTGWVHKYLFEDGADMVVVKQPSSIYEKPNELGTLTNDKFEPGELVAMTSFVEGWIQLTGIERKQKGWIRWDENAEAVSVDDKDIAIAMQMIKAEQQGSDYQEIQSLKALRNQEGFASSPVRPAVERRINELQNDITTDNAVARTRPTSTRSAARPPATSMSSSELQRLIDLNGPPPGEEEAVAGTFTPVGTTTPASTLRAKAAVPTPGYDEELVQDATTGQHYIKVTERGRVYEVITVDNTPSIYYAYHKTLPRGTRILLNVPDNPGFVELEITNVLGANREQMIALPRELIDVVWGKGTPAKDIEATIVYFVKQ